MKSVKSTPVLLSVFSPPLLGSIFLVFLGVFQGRALASETIVIASGDDFTFERTSSFEVNVHVVNQYAPSGSYSSAKGRQDVRLIGSSRTFYVDGHSALKIKFNGEEYVIEKSGRSDKSYSDKSEADKEAPELTKALLKGETLALELMKKNLSVVDDTAGVVREAKPVVRSEDFQFNTVLTKQKFRYALVLELEDEKVKTYRFIRQGASE